jgi:hypothetical protein
MFANHAVSCAIAHAPSAIDCGKSDLARAAGFRISFAGRNAASTKAAPRCDRLGIELP